MRSLPFVFCCGIFSSLACFLCLPTGMTLVFLAVVLSLNPEKLLYCVINNSQGYVFMSAELKQK